MEGKPQEKANAFTIKDNKLVHTFRGLVTDRAGSEIPKYVVSDCRMRVKLTNANSLFIEMHANEGRISTKVPRGLSLCTKCQQAAGRRLVAQQTQIRPMRAVATPKKVEEKVE